MKYIKKPIVVEAFRYGFDEKPEWFLNSKLIDESNNFCKIKTLEGIMIANSGDWIIKGIKGELYPCKHEIFQDSYDKVKDQKF